EFRFQTFVGLQRIRIEIRPRFYVFLHEVMKRLFLPSGRNGYPDVALAFKQSNHDSFTTAASAFDLSLPDVTVHVSGFAANESLVNFDVSSELAEGSRSHGRTNTVIHEPS